MKTRLLMEKWKLMYAASVSGWYWGTLSRGNWCWTFKRNTVTREDLNRINGRGNCSEEILRGAQHELPIVHQRDEGRADFWKYFEPVWVMDRLWDKMGSRGVEPLPNTPTWSHLIVWVYFLWVRNTQQRTGLWWLWISKKTSNFAFYSVFSCSVKYCYRLCMAEMIF